MIQDSQTCAEIVLIFDRATFRPSIGALQALSGRLRQVEDVVSVMTRLDLHGSQQVIVFYKSQVESQQILRRMAGALRTPATAEPGAVSANHRIVDSEVKVQPRCRGVIITSRPADVTTSGISTVPDLPTRLRHFVYGTLAAGAFGMAWVGLLVPGIPTVPFVILTAYLAAKASPAFHQRLLKSRTFGPMIQDWEAHHAIRPSVRKQAVLLTLVIVVLTAIAAPPSVSLYLLIASMATFSLVVVSMLPVIDEPEATAESASNSTRTLAVA